MKKFSAVVFSACAALIVALAGCGGGGGGSTITPTDPAKDDTNGLPYFTITGKVVRADTGAGLPGVNILFGTPQVVATTGSDGTFALKIINVSIEELRQCLFPVESYPYGEKFKVDISSSPAAAFVTQYAVKNDTNGNGAIDGNEVNPDLNNDPDSLDYSEVYSKSSVSVPTAIFRNGSTSIGTITIGYYDPSDISMPPPLFPLDEIGNTDPDNPDGPPSGP